MFSSDQFPEHAIITRQWVDRLIANVRSGRDKMPFSIPAYMGKEIHSEEDAALALTDRLAAIHDYYEAQRIRHDTFRSDILELIEDQEKACAKLLLATKYRRHGDGRRYDERLFWAGLEDGAKNPAEPWNEMNAILKGVGDLRDRLKVARAEIENGNHLFRETRNSPQIAELRKHVARCYKEFWGKPPKFSIFGSDPAGPFARFATEVISKITGNPHKARTLKAGYDSDKNRTWFSGVREPAPDLIEKLREHVRNRRCE